MSDRQIELWEQRFEWQTDNIKRLESEVRRLEAENAELKESLKEWMGDFYELRQALAEVEDEDEQL